MLRPHEPPPVISEREDADSPFVITCDHAGRDIPEALGDLGLGAADRERHIAWDIGALGVARSLAGALDAPLIAQRYSRLVIDCNRPPHHPDLIPVTSEGTVIAHNETVDEGERSARLESIYVPYHEALSALLDRRAARGLATVFVAVHSFTPVYHGAARPWHLGVLYGEDARFAGHLLRHFRADDTLCVGDNEPYRIDEKDHGIPAHAERRGLAHALLEIRQDLLLTEAARRDWSERLARALEAGLGALGG